MYICLSYTMLTEPPSLTFPLSATRLLTRLVYGVTSTCFQEPLRTSRSARAGFCCRFSTGGHHMEKSYISNEIPREFFSSERPYNFFTTPRRCCSCTALSTHHISLQLVSSMNKTWKSGFARPIMLLMSATAMSKVCPPSTDTMSHLMSGCSPTNWGTVNKDGPFTIFNRSLPSRTPWAAIFFGSRRAASASLAYGCAHKSNMITSAVGLAFNHNAALPPALNPISQMRFTKGS
mmetsp:Transcript_100555/g.281761  ORF Transcript_100555/g.281761 Transcript_100555/m.281761 type:complete len:234 (-) Transcript_100555:476-1177(-)